MITTNFIVAQILGIIATIILSLSYLLKSKTKFLLLGIVGDLVYGCSFIFVNAYSTTIIVVISCIQNLVYYFYSKNKKNPPEFLPFLFIALFIIGGIINFNSGWDIIPIIAYCWYTCFMDLKNMTAIRIAFFFPNLIIAVYDIIVMAYGSALEDSIEAIILLILIIRDIKKYKAKNQNLQIEQKTIKNNSLKNTIKVIDYDKLITTNNTNKLKQKGIEINKTHQEE